MLKGCRRQLQGPPDVIGFKACEQLYGLAREMQRSQRVQLPKPIELGWKAASSYDHPGNIYQRKFSI